MKIAYQGVQGAFSWQAGIQQFGAQASYIGLRSFKELFKAVENGTADFAVVPYENSLIGTIYENCNLLAAADLEIVAESYLRIEHSLLVLPEVTDLKQIEKVYSHPKALEQCRHFFASHPWIVPVVHEDTAGAAQEIATQQKGAIAHAGCAALYGLNVLLANIEDDKKNYTRFIFVRKKGIEQEEWDKATVFFELKNRPGDLHRVLGLIAEKQVNVTQIVSRPIVGKPFEYTFYIDLQWNQTLTNHAAFLELLARLRENTEQFRCLGIYEGKIYEQTR